MYLNSDNWLKGSVEYENEKIQHLGSVATNHGSSFKATFTDMDLTECKWLAHDGQQSAEK